jgi:chorismate synthase
MIIKNTNANSHEYSTLLRPGHADWTQYIKYGSILPGGGQFSGRLTAPVVFTGAICKQLLIQNKIIITSKIYSIGNIYNPTQKQINEIITRTQNSNNSIGGIIEAEIKNVPLGLGSDFFGGIEAKISNLLFSIPGVKGVEFGDGFKISHMNGDQTNDEIYIKNKKIYSKTNHMGGILGGISNGMPIVVRVGFKPTPSIGIAQNTVNISNMKQEKITINGRHDPCIAIRGQIVVEAYLAIAMLDLVLEKK